MFRLVQIKSLCRQENKCTGNLKTETLFEMGKKRGKRRKCWLPLY